jgi:hypothetical protein
MLPLSFPRPNASSSHRFNEKHTWAIEFNTVEFLFHPQLFPVRMTTISGVIENL